MGVPDLSSTSKRQICSFSYVIQEAPLQLWANFRQRSLDPAIAEIAKKTDLNIEIESLERSKHRRVISVTFAIKEQAVPDDD
jgi:plasmid replication initiation protein